MYRQRLRCLPFQRTGQAQIPAGCTNADLVSAAFCIEIMQLRLIIGKAALVQRELHIFALTGLQGYLGKTLQLPDRAGISKSAMAKAMAAKYGTRSSHSPSAISPKVMNIIHR